MITISKEIIDSFSGFCAEGLSEVEDVWKDKEPTFVYNIKDIPTCLEYKLILAYELGVTYFDILLFLSPYNNEEEFKEAYVLPENQNLITRPDYFKWYYTIERFLSDKAAFGFLTNNLSEKQVDNFLSNHSLT